MPLVSILIPAYNRPEYLKICLDSVFSQKGFSHNDLEIIVADDSTNDENTKMFQKYFQDTNIIYLKNEKNLGMVQNWNHLLHMKTGKYFIFLSDDDLFYDENSLKVLYDTLLKHKLNFIYGLRMIIDENGDKISNENICKLNSIHNISVKKVLQSPLGGFGGILYANNSHWLVFDSKVGLATDWDFNIRYIRKYGGAAIIERYTFVYRKHYSNLSNDTTLMSESENIILKRYSASYFSFLLIKYRKLASRNVSPIFIKLVKMLGCFDFFLGLSRKYKYGEKLK